MEDFTFFDFTESTRKGSGRRLREHTFSVVYNDSSCITINIEDGKIIREKQMTHLRVRKDNVTGELCLVFNKERGIPLKLEKDVQTTTIQCKALVEFLYHELSLRLEKRTRHIFSISENIANSDEYVTFRILNEVDDE